MKDCFVAEGGHLLFPENPRRCTRCASYRKRRRILLQNHEENHLFVALITTSSLYDGILQYLQAFDTRKTQAGPKADLTYLTTQVEEMEAAISYIRSNITTTQPSHIVLMGHSTGCQDLMHYLLSPTGSPRPSISGAVFQAPVSDREAILHEVETSEAARNAYETALSICSDTPVAKHKSMILPLDVMTPLFGPAPVSVSRFLSLASPDSPGTPSMDDYFSSDLLDERLAETFGRVGSLTHLLPSQAGTGTKSILMLHGTEDKSVPSHIDKASLISRWKDFLSKGGARLDPNTAIIEHANHDISGETVEVREARLVKMRSAVLHYLDDRVGGVGEGAHAVWKGDADAIKEEGYAKRLERRTSVDDSKL